MNPTRQGERGTTSDRVAGAILGMACGDALGAGYEFGPPLPPNEPIVMDGDRRGPWEPGEWTDDTSMAVPILRVLASGRRLEGAALDEIAASWLEWAEDAKDVGNQTRAVFSATTSPTADAMLAASRDFARSHARSAGNGSLMRTAPVALGFLADCDERAIVRTARLIGDLTHADPIAGDACVLWSLAIRRAIREGVLDLRAGLSFLPTDRAAYWAERIDEAEAGKPADFVENFWVVGALQGAWSAIVHGSTLVDVLERAVRGGRDADTVAAIAGGLAGAVAGASALPARWRRILHGWPNRTNARQLTEWAVLAEQGGRPDAYGWPSTERITAPSQEQPLTRHPFDDGVWMGPLNGLDKLPDEVTAVVSLARVGVHQTDREDVPFWLIDKPGRNANVDFVVRDAADTIAALRSEGKVVYLHCHDGRSRTAAVAAAYAALHRGVEVEEALTAVTSALPYGAPSRFLVEAVRRVAAAARSGAPGPAADRTVG